MPDKSRAAWLIGAIADRAFDYFFLGKVIAFGASALAGVSAIMGNIELPWAIGLAALVFYLISGGMYFFAEYVQLTKVAGRFGLANINVEIDAESSRPMYVLYLVNTAPFAITWKLNSVSTSLNKTLPYSDDYSRFSTSRTPANGVTRWADHYIDIPESERGKFLFGDISISISYGKGLKLKHELALNFEAKVKLDEDGQIEVHSIYNRAKK